MSEAVKFGMILFGGMILGAFTMYLLSMLLMWRAYTQR